MNSGETINARIAVWLAWSMFVLSLALTALGLLLLILSLSQPVIHIYDNWLEDTLFGMSCATIGAVIISCSDPKNTIGWLFCAIGFFWAVSHFAAQYAIYTLIAAPGSLPAGEAAAWIYSWLSVADLGFIVFLLLLFPDHRLPGRGWRWFAWLSALLVLAGTVSGAFSPGPGNVGLGPIRNPLGIEDLPNVYKPVETLMLTLIFVAVASLFVRLHRARGEERQQVKWFAYASMLAISGAILTHTLSEVIGARWLEWTGYIATAVGLLAVPVTMGIAIMRYRLYDIDIIINRTLVYAVLTTSLALVYFGGVALLEGVLFALTGQESQLAHSQLAVVASTLAVAGLFGPLRRRVQALIDRRFYRSRYDAAKMIKAFSAKVRDEVDLEKLTEELLAVIDETVQPVRVSLWLRPPQRQDTKGE